MLLFAISILFHSENNDGENNRYAFIVVSLIIENIYTDHVAGVQFWFAIPNGSLLIESISNVPNAIVSLQRVNCNAVWAY